MIVSDKELVKYLKISGEGEMIIAGTILKGLSDEEIAWVVLEIAEVKAGKRFTLHAYWHDIFVVSKVVTLTPDDQLKWGRSSL